jgi:hypothetical protein
MKKVLLLPLVMLFLCGCQNQEREKRLVQREAELAQREQELLIRENRLNMLEQRLAKQAQDSTQKASVDSAGVDNLVGTWNTRMNCIETDCPGSAIGDSKTEQWQISYEAGAFLVKATVNNQIARVYSGTLTGNTLELTAQHLPNESLPDASITAQLEVVGDQRLQGRRVIDRPNTCRIVYALDMTKEPIPSR